MDSRIEQLAQNVVRYSCGVEPGDKVLIDSQGSSNDDFVKALIREVYKIGAVPFLWERQITMKRELLLNSTKEQLEIAAEADGVLMSHMDAYIRMRGEENSAELSDIPVQNLRDFAEIYHHKVHSRRPDNEKWCVMHYPTPGTAQAEGMSTQAWEDYFFEVCGMDYSKMNNAFKPLKELMDRTDKVRITAKDTDLSFSIKGIGAVASAGQNNIPDGEIFTAPVVGSVEGYITYNTTAYYDGYAFENICFKFKEGRIAEATANDTERLNSILDTDEGARVIGEFAIGVNPYITKPRKDSMFNEKMTGSIHFTPGDHCDGTDNGNHSSVHWDIVLAQTPEFGGGDIYFDDVLIRHDGRFVLPELVGLNPENLM